MNRLSAIKKIRNKLLNSNSSFSIGSWMQLSDASIAEIMGQSNYDWVAIDLEHGSIDISQLPDIFRALELGETLPLVRLAEGHPKDCKQALDAGAGGVIVPMVEDAGQLKLIKDFCRWPPSGRRGVGFSRANLFGKFFEDYSDEAQQPLLVAMIESLNAVKSLEAILQVDGLDAILIGPYDLSASMNLTANFSDPKFINTINKIRVLCDKYSVACGMHIVNPKQDDLRKRIDEGYKFIAYSIDAVFLSEACENPIKS
ncbi:aldolase/citrate lyase family protein [Candidatus Thioglobus sp.]|jgi:2-dehydro-3-deoxyglucarate aldolase|nr:aldolase/citrate lyase family protein [Candidatus Thioglobus sp.]